MPSLPSWARQRVLKHEEEFTRQKCGEMHPR